MRVTDIRKLVLIVSLACCALPACQPAPSAPSPSLTLDLRDPALKWEAGFADVSVGTDDRYGFVADYRALPPPLHGGALYQEGMNASDDLCMWFTIGVGGFDPGLVYAVSFDVGIASDSNEGCDMGIGAATFVKAGASGVPPGRKEEGGWWRMNVDKGIPGGDGTQALRLGDIRNAIPGCPPMNHPWGERGLSSGEREVRVRPASDGTIWVFVLTDSTWEGFYRLYFTYMDLWIRALPP